VRWAKHRFGVEIDAGELREGGAEERRHVYEVLCAAAEHMIDEADLGGLDEYFEPDYGPRQLSDWAHRMLGLEVPVEEIKRAQADEERTAAGLLVQRAEEVYREKEISYPVEYAMELTMALMRQSPAQAAEQLAGWSRRRFGLELTAEGLKTTPPARVREMLLDESRRFVEEDRLNAEIEAALGCEDDDALAEHLDRRFGMRLPERIRHIDPDERDDAVRALIENILRSEMLELERAVLLETLDSSWKDHLYEMDQLRDSISFRAFSQQDPRIAFKREGSQIFQAMLARIRDRVSEYIFKARMRPGEMIQQAQAAMAMRQAQAQAQVQAQAEPPAPDPAQRAEAAGGAEPVEGDGAPGRAASPESDDAAELDPTARMQAAQAAREGDRTKKRRR